MKFFKKGERMSPADFAAKLASGDTRESVDAAIALSSDSNELGVSIELLLHQFIEPTAELNAVESVFAELNIPLSPSGEEGAMMLAATSDSFTTNLGLKVLLPILIDNIIRAAQNTVPFENVEDLLASTRNVTGAQLLTDILYDKNTADSYGTFRIAEGGRIPVRTLKTSQGAVQFYKHGSGIEISYEVTRRMSPDVLVPFANRIAFERGQSEMLAAIEILINGDGIKPAAPVETLATFDGVTTGKLRDRAEGFMKWLMAASKAGRPIDTIVVNYDSLFELSFMFPVQNTANVPAVGVGNVGQQAVGMTVSFAKGLSLNLKVVVSAGIGANQILGFRKGETLERLIETGSAVQETETSVRNQMLTYVNTINSGFNIAYGESRRVLTWTPS